MLLWEITDDSGNLSAITILVQNIRYLSLYKNMYAIYIYIFFYTRIHTFFCQNQCSWMGLFFFGASLCLKLKEF